MREENVAAVEFEICLRAEVGGDKSKAMAIIKFRKDAYGQSCRQQLWQPPRDREPGTATSTKEPAKGKLVDVVLAKLIPEVSQSAEVRAIVDATVAERAPLLKVLLQKWLQDAAKAAGESLKTDIGEVSAVYGILGEEARLDSFFGQLAVTMQILTPEEAKKVRIPPGVTFPPPEKT